MEAIDALLQWAATQGIKLNGIQPKVIPGRGIGVVATRRLEAEEDILDVPTKALRSYTNTPKSITRKLQGASVQAMLAVSLCLDESRDLKLWKAVFPEKGSFLAGMPMFWPPELQELLPSSATAILEKQQAKFDADWALVQANWPEDKAHDGDDAVSLDDFRYTWFLANSRTFYHTTPHTERKLPKEDHMVLQPVADLFNHSSADDSSRAAYDAKGYTVTTKRAYDAGDEVFIRYGAHSNDFLLVEYGFTLPVALNQWDEMRLDAYICPLVASAPRGGQRRDMLEEAGFWGRYLLDGETACYRTQMALRALCLDEKEWGRVRDGERDEDADAEEANKFLAGVLRQCEKDIRKRLNVLDKTTVGEEAMRSSLRDRWLQLRELVRAGIDRLE